MPDTAPRAVPSYFPEVMSWFERMPQCKTLGLRYVAAEAGKVTLELPFQKALIGNPETRVIHGGAVTTLIDTASGVSLFTLLPEPEVVATLDLRIDYLRPAKPDLPVFCTAECYRLTEHIAFTRATAFQDDIARPVACAVATFARGAGQGKGA